MAVADLVSFVLLLAPPAPTALDGIATVVTVPLAVGFIEATSDLQMVARQIGNMSGQM